MGSGFFKAGNQPDCFVFGVGNTPISYMLSLSNDPDNGLNTWPSFTQILAESHHWQNGDLSLVNPTVAGFWRGVPFLEGENRVVKSRGDFLLEIWLISLYRKEIVPAALGNFRGDLSLAEHGITSESPVCQIEFVEQLHSLGYLHSLASRRCMAH